jgi:hypothetical protein
MRVIAMPNAGGLAWQRRLPGELRGQQRVGVVMCARPGCDYARLTLTVMTDTADLFREIRNDYQLLS